MKRRPFLLRVGLGLIPGLLLSRLAMSADVPALQPCPDDVNLPPYKGFDRGQCTGFVAIQRDLFHAGPVAKSLGVDGLELDWEGHAKEWPKNAEAKGWIVLYADREHIDAATLMPGAILVFSGTHFGHVAIVDRFTAEAVRILHTNGGDPCLDKNGVLHMSKTTEYSEFGVGKWIQFTQLRSQLGGLTLTAVILPRKK